jgi:hypothetical protein
LRRGRGDRRTTARDGVSAPEPARRARALLWTAAIFAGVAVRLIALSCAPQYSYLPDHVSFMDWSAYAFDNGPWRIYELDAGRPVIVRLHDAQGRAEDVVRFNRHACNYPPLSAYGFWLQGALWNVLDSRVATFEAGRRPSGTSTIIRGRIANTFQARLANALPAMACDFVLAAGVAALVSAVRREPSEWRRLGVFTVTLLAPPIFLDSAFWNQVDSWVTAALVWCLVLLLKGRWWRAGGLLGLAVVTKPQAILFAPVLAYAVLALRFGPGGTWRDSAKLLRTAGAALAAVAIIAAPFMLNDTRAPGNPHGAWRWLQRSYVETIGSPLYERTTLSAFNLWWIDLLAQGPPGPGGWEPLWDPRVIVAGLSKAAWGKLFLAAALLGAASLCAWRWRWNRTTWVALAAVTLLAAFALPTRVHERYVYFCIPFLLAMAMLRRWWAVPAAVMLVVGTFEMTSFRWAGLARLYEPDGVAWAGSLLLAVCTVVSLGLSLALLAAEKANRREKTLTPTDVQS